MSFNFVAMIPRIVFLVIMLVACVLIIRLFLTNKIESSDVRAEVFISGLLYDKGGIGYYDELTGRHYPEIVSLAQLDDVDLESTLYYPANKMIAARITVLDKDESLLKEVYYNKKWWDNWSPLLKRALPGRGGVALYERLLPIIYIDNTGNKKMGLINFEVVQPKS